MIIKSVVAFAAVPRRPNNITLTDRHSQNTPGHPDERAQGGGGLPGWGPRPLCLPVRLLPDTEVGRHHHSVCHSSVPRGGHWQRWQRRGQADPAEFTEDTTGPAGPLSPSTGAASAGPAFLSALQS